MIIIKKLICLLFFCLISISSVYSLSISLTSPADAAIERINPVLLKCKSDDTPITKIELWTNKTGIWAITDTDNAPISGSDSIFSSSFTKGNQFWGCGVYNSTGNSFSMNRTFIMNENHAPTISIPDQYAQEDTSNTTINLASYSNDTDGDSLTYTIANENASRVNCEISGSTLTATCSSDFVGTSTCTVNASDGLVGTTDIFVVYVANIEDAPRFLKDISNQVFSTGQTKSIKLTPDYFIEPDNEALTFNTSATPSHFNITFVSGEAKITSLDSWIGSENIIFMATDTKLVTSSNQIKLTVSTGNNETNITTTTTTSSTTTSSTSSTTSTTWKSSTTTTTLESNIKKEGSNTLLIIAFSIVGLIIVGWSGFYYFKYKNGFKDGDEFVELGKKQMSIKSKPIEQVQEDPIKPVVDYIKKCSKMGYNLNEIKNVLRSKGWDDNQIDEAVRRFNNG